MTNKKGFQLSINMIVVMILGLTLMGVGFSIFFNAYNQTVDIKETVDSQTQRQLNELLDSGDAIVIPISSKEAERGDYVDFDLGISNELDEPKIFYVYIRFDGFSGKSLGTTTPKDIRDALHAFPIEDKSCREGNYDERSCADNWVLISRINPSDDGKDNDRFLLNNNERYMFPIRFVLPKKMELDNGDTIGLPTGQYIFNADVYYSTIYTSFDDCNAGNKYCECDTENSANCKAYFSKKKIYIKVN